MFSLLESVATLLIAVSLSVHRTAYLLYPPISCLVVARESSGFVFVNLDYLFYALMRFRTAFRLLLINIPMY